MICVGIEMGRIWDLLEIIACLEIGSCLRSEAIYGDLTGYRDLTRYRDGWRWVQREDNKSENGERKREGVRI